MVLQNVARIPPCLDDSFAHSWYSLNQLHAFQLTDTSQHQLFRGDCQSGIHGGIAAKKPLLKDTNNKKRLAWAKKHEH
ncbi:unnamed protein product [Oncorhynchus mykiss]|uniref:Transposase Tc1-like domain-containing protein n=1 Tax=Oncorhynchus mykiss TaxID=8022 RepID=A0A060WBB7_ONCMY|nr:unnamed protein product [Oncorhynchus mykiss]